MTTVDRLSRSFNNVPDFPLLQDFRSALISAPGYIGVFRADDPSYLSQDAGGNIAQLNDWAGLATLQQPTQALKPVRTYDVEVGRYVIGLNILAASTMRLNGTAFAPNGAWTVAALVKILQPLSGIANIAGMCAGPPNSQNAGIQIGGTSLVAYANAQQQPLVDGTQLQNRWARVIVSWNYNGTQRLEVNGQLQTYNLSGVPPTTPFSFDIGSQFFPFGGLIDCVAAFNADLYATANVAWLNTLKRYFDQRGV